jgi:hypothetical protein
VSRCSWIRGDFIVECAILDFRGGTNGNGLLVTTGVILLVVNA